MSTPPFVNSTQALQTAVRYGALGIVALAVGSALVSGFLLGAPGVWAAIFGALVGGIFVILTAVGVLFTAKLPANVAGSVLLGGWLLKMVVAILVMAALDTASFLDHRALAVTVLLSLVVVLGAEVYGVLGRKLPYIDGPSGPPPGHPESL